MTRLLKHLFFIVLSVYSAPISFKSCGDGSLILRDLSIDPFPLQKTVESSVIAHATLNRDFSTGNYDIVLELGGLQIYSKSGDVCSFDANLCPQKAGEKTIVKNFTVPNLAPSGSYQAKATIHSEDQLVACYSFEFNLD